MTTTLWVSPDVDTWRLQKEGSYCPERICHSRDEAIDWACRLATDLAPCQVKVQDYSGRITAEFGFSGRVVSAAE